MAFLVIETSPNFDGLTARCAAAALEGFSQAGKEAQDVRLNDLNIGSCQACGNGWGTCLPDHTCQVLDDFQALHARLLDADGLVLVTPVYWGEMSESAKNLTDRLRRCEATRQPESGLKGKGGIAVAAAGGSGGGMITCLASIERWMDHTRIRKFDLIAVNRWNQVYKIQAIQSAAKALAGQQWA